VTEYYRVRALACDAGFQRVGRKLGIHDVLHEKPAAGQFNQFRLRIPETRIIRIASNCRHRCDLPQSEEDGRQPDVTRVEDMVHAGEKARDPRIEVVVRVRDDADVGHET
jgi:hypothetical protein